MLARGSRDTITTNIVQQTVGILIFLTVPNILSVDAFSEITFVGVLLSFSILADCGVSIVYSRKMPAVHASGNQADIDRWNSSVFWTAVVGSTVFGLVVSAVYGFKYSNPLMALLLLPVPLLAAVVSFNIGRMTAQADFSTYRTINSFQAIAKLVTIPLTYWLGLLGWFVSQVISAAFTLLRLRKPLVQPRAGYDWNLIRGYLAEGALLVTITFLWLQLLYSGRLFAAIYYPNEAIAQYGLLNAGYQVVASLVIAAFLPVTVETYKLCGGDGKAAAKFVFRVMNLSVLPVFLLAVIAAELSPILFPIFFPKYQIDTFILKSLVYSLLSFPILVSLGNLFIGRAKSLHYVAILFLSLGFNWLLVLVLNPHLGRQAAAIAQLASIGVCALLMLLTAFYVFRDIIEKKSCKFLMIVGQLGLLSGTYLLIRSIWA